MADFDKWSELNMNFKLEGLICHRGGGALLACLLIAAFAPALGEPLYLRPGNQSVVLVAAAPSEQVEPVAGPSTALSQYRLDSGDTLQIDMLLPGPSSINQRIDINGMVTLYPAGSIVVKGLTTDQARSKIEKVLRKYFHRPIVAVRILEVRTFYVTVSGAVGKPGRYLMDGLSGVSDLLQKAGGPGGEGRPRSIEVYDPTTGTTSIIDYLRWLRKGTKGDNPRLRPEQAIHVRPRNEDVRITGQIVYPGVYEILPNETYEHFFDSAIGGFLQSADKRHIQVSRLLPTGERERVILDLDSKQDSRLKVQAGDDVTVLDGSIYQSSIIVIGELKGTLDSQVAKVEASSNRYASETAAADAARNKEARRIKYRIWEGERVSEVVAKLGGPTVMANLHRARVQRKNSAGKTENLDFSLIEAIKNPGGPHDKVLKDYDTLIIPPIPDSVYMIGQIDKTGAIPFKPGIGLREYLALAGGPKENALLGEARLIRIKDNPETPSIYEIDLNHYLKDKNVANLVMEPGDMLFIPMKGEPLLTQMSQAISLISPILFLLK